MIGQMITLDTSEKTMVEICQTALDLEIALQEAITIYEQSKEGEQYE